MEGGSPGQPWVRPIKPAELELSFYASDGCTHCTFHTAQLRQKHTDLLEEKDQMCCQALRVLGTNLVRWNASGFCANSPRPSFQCLPALYQPPLKPPPPCCCCQGLFSPLPGPFRLIPEQILAQSSPISWTLFSMLPLAVDSVSWSSALPCPCQLLAQEGWDRAGVRLWRQTDLCLNPSFRTDSIL